VARNLQCRIAMKTTTFAWVLVLTTVGATGCVSTGKYNEAISQTQVTRVQLGRTSAELATTTAQLEQERSEIARLEGLIAEASRSSLRDRSSNENRIMELRKRLDELKAAQAAAESRAALFRDVALRLKKQIDAGDLTIVVRDGRMVLQLPNDVLFDTGRTELKPSGEAALTAIAGVIEFMPDRHFQVAGHTDNVPIHNERFPSNWELSSGRALRVVHYLIDHRVPASTLSAAGYGEMDPVSTNETLPGRKNNRRTEITLQPNINEILPVP
jgi:chemotaxis protein MotB